MYVCVCMYVYVCVIPQGLNVLIAIRSSIRLIKQLSFIQSKFTSISQEVDETIRFSWTPPLILHEHVSL